MLKYKYRFCRETQNRTFSSKFDVLLTPNPNFFQLEEFSTAAFVPLILSLCALFSNFGEKTGNFWYWFTVQWQIQVHSICAYFDLVRQVSS